MDVETEFIELVTREQGLTEADNSGTEIYAEELNIKFNGESSEGFLPTPSTASNSPVTIYRLVKLEQAEALGISLEEGSVTLPNNSTKIITRNIIKLRKPPKKMVLAQKNSRTAGTSGQCVDRHDDSYYRSYIMENTNVCNTAKRYSCKVCMKSFRHVSHLKRHINSHTGDKQYRCDSCGKGFVDVSTLCRHRKTHTGERPFTCKSCRKSFGTLGSLRRHVTVHNQESRPYLCSVCSKRFPDNSSFQKHRLIHSGVKPFSCEVCTKAFVHIGDLNGHRKVHEEKPWQCDQCDKKFSKQSNCIRHAQIHILGDKEFVCHLCGVGYNFKSSLTRHLLTHRKDRTRRPPNRNLMILRKVERGMGRQKEGQSLTLGQIKNLLCVKSTATNVSDSSEVGTSEASGHAEAVFQDEDLDDPDIIKGEGEEEEEEEEEEEDGEGNGAEDENQLEDESDENSEEDDSENLIDQDVNNKDTFILKHITADGKFEFIVKKNLG